MIQIRLVEKKKASQLRKKTLRYTKKKNFNYKGHSVTYLFT